MTPAVKVATQEKIPFSLHEYAHDPKSQSYGLEAAEKLGVEPSRVFKTLLLELDKDRFAIAVIPVDKQLNLKRFAKALGAKKVALAALDGVQRVTGYVAGGVSPLGQKRQLPTVVDESALRVDSIYISGGKRGLDMELAAQDLIELTNAVSKNIV